MIALVHSDEIHRAISGFPSPYHMSAGPGRRRPDHCPASIFRSATRQRTTITAG